VHPDTLTLREPSPDVNADQNARWLVGIDLQPDLPDDGLMDELPRKSIPKKGAPHRRAPQFSQPPEEKPTLRLTGAAAPANSIGSLAHLLGARRVNGRQVDRV
jgi:hypothetical protein